MNWGIEVLQTSALPLGYVATHVTILRCMGAAGSYFLEDLCACHETRAFKLLARVAGFEPANDGVRVHCLTAWRYPNINHSIICKNGVDNGIRTHACRSHNPVS